MRYLLQSLEIARRRWKRALLLSGASLLIALIWLGALERIRYERQQMLEAIAARSLSALQQSASILHTLLWQETRSLMPSDISAFISARVNQVLAAAQALANAEIWIYCSACEEKTTPSAFETLRSAVTDMLSASHEGVSQQTDPSGADVLIAWTTLSLGVQTWQIGLALPLNVVLAQADLQAHGIWFSAVLGTLLVVGVTLLSLALRRRERLILRLLQATQAHASQQEMVNAALSDISLALTSVLELEEVMARILRNVGRVVPCYSVSVLLLDSQVCRLAYSRLAEGKVSYIREYALSPELRQVFDEMVRTRQPRLISDTETDPRWIRAENQAHVKSYIGMPIMAQDQVIGILNLSSDKRHYFTQQHTEILRIFAAQAGVALQNARLYAESVRYAAELERRVQERTLQLTQRSALFEAIVENMADGLAYFDLRTQRTLYVNQAFLRMSGCSREELLDQPLETFKRFFRDPEVFEKARGRLREANRLREIWQTEFEAVRADGSAFICLLTATIVRNAADEPIGQLNLVRDVTNERTLQKQRERFIANASHELRTPIANLKLRLYLAQRDPNNLRKHFEVMERMVNHLTRLVENLLDLPRFEQGTLVLHRERVDLCELVRTATEMHQPRAAECHIALHLQLPEDCVSANVDPMRLTQVIDNLIANALNYTPANGEVRVQLSTQAENGLTVAIIKVSDNGVGIPPEALVHIFEPFFRARTVQNVRGTGLGLTIAKQIVELHRGVISVESREGVGSTFTVRLPIQRHPDNNANT
ncbi:MAG: hypothetical protein CUN49_05345 [Candidatus Thermofonsia Clade 1 bacterium]|uniref:histidine kinase n=1 Tax=Candidatus Thermofonsia Clade 1 bacterium TaxID=2364210 RepID=A0A2M8PG02_9CHLR|nr:MAG: hypothetical protein CUN49_05345 [Candidatus Thermofonsia Clade 1 bacterium]RMF50131.1 MAG: GAF domain-containing protein [Chloroflexota bacterium]